MTPPATPRAFRVLLSLLPAAFRRRYADDMGATFRARLAGARAHGPFAVARLWIRTAVDLVQTAVAERRQSSLALAPATAAAPSNTETHMSGWINDLRFAARQLRRQPAHAAFVALTLAVGIGATTAVFSVVRGVLLRPLPFPDSDRLVTVRGRFLPESGFDFPQFPLSVPEYLDYRDQARTVEDVALYQTGSATVGADEGSPERVRIAAITPNTMRLLRVPVALGRELQSEDGVPNAPRAVILSHGYWQRRYAGDPGVLGRALRVSGTDRTIVGVAPDGFAFPSREIAFWQPFVIDPAAPGSRQSHSSSAIARLAPGVTLEAAEAEMEGLMRQWKVAFPTIHTGHFLFLRPMLEDVVGPVSTILLLLLSATGVLLLIVCANVSNVLLARGEGRAREMAIRAALGAERRRLVRLAALESLVLAAIGGAAGVAIAWGGVRLLRALEGTGVPRVDDVGLDAGVLAFAAALTMLSAVVFGMAPALRGSIVRPAAAMRQDDRTASAGGARLRFRRVLVTVEVALTVVLVVSAALMLQSLRRVLAVDPGFEPRGVVLADVALPTTSYPDVDRVQQFYAAVVDRLRVAPGVTDATAASLVPMLRGSGVWDFEIAGQPAPAAGAPAWNAAIGFVRDDFFEALRLPIRRGRAIGREDGPGQPAVAVVSESFARKFFADEDPVGRRVRVAGDTTRPWATIVGVAGDVRDQDLETPERPIYYLAHAQVAQTASGTFGSMTLIARTTTPDAVSLAIREIVRGLDPDLPVTVQQYAQALSLSYARRSFATTLFGAFAAVGLLLGATGIYAVLVYGVARLTPEIGIRRALGATPRGIVGLVARQGLVPAGIGLVAGLGIAALAGRWLESQLFDIAPTDPLTFGMVAAGVSVVAIAASLVPARRALRINPAQMLR